MKIFLTLCMFRRLLILIQCPHIDRMELTSFCLMNRLLCMSCILFICLNFGFIGLCMTCIELIYHNWRITALHLLILQILFLCLCRRLLLLSFHPYLFMNFRDFNQIYSFFIHFKEVLHLSWKTFRILLIFQHMIFIKNLLNYYQEKPLIS